MALPEGSRHVEPGLVHHAPTAAVGEGWSVSVFLGSLLGQVSPVSTHTPLLGAELRLDAGTTLELAVEESFELGFLLDRGGLEVDGCSVAQDELAFVAPGRGSLRLAAGAEGARVVILGGPPFGESIVMWWNFVGRTHDDIVASRAQWQAQIDGARTGQDVRPGRFGIVADQPLAPIPAPVLPNARLRSRR